VTERAERLLIPPVYSLRGIRAYDDLQKLLQPKSGKPNRWLQCLLCVPDSSDVLNCAMDSDTKLLNGF